MFVLVTGGSGSGKSAFAESILDHKEKKIYIATMLCRDEESKKRIERHRRLRSGKGFETLEIPFDLKQARIPEHANVLLECTSNLLANEMFCEEGSGENAEKEILEGILRLKEQADTLCVVTNEIFSDGIEYDPYTREYQRLLGRINQQMASIADEVYEIVYSIPLCLKGGDKE